MKRIVLWLLVFMMFLGISTALASHPGDTITVELQLNENPNNAISARVGFTFGKNIFEFLEAKNLSPDIPITPPAHDAAMFGLINMNGLTVGPIGSITLKISPDAPLGRYLIEPIVDEVYDRDKKPTTIVVKNLEVVLEHTYDEGVITTPAGCQTTGTKTFTCLYCTATRTETIPATGHSYKSVVTAPNCTESGYTTYTCSTCGDTYKADETPAKGHTEVVDKAVEATCTTAGKTEGKHCSVCNAVIVAQTTIPAKGHTEVVDKAVEATCTAAGKTEGKHCSVCNAVIVAQTTIPAKGHTEVVDKAVEATCTAAGKTEGKHCSVCNAVIVAQTTIPAKGHTEVVDKAVEATCTAAGKTEGKHCSVCNAVIVAQTTIPAKGHTWDSGVVTKEPTTAEEGVKTFTCTACKTTRTESIPKLEILRFPGDADGSNSIDILDALLTLQFSVGWSVGINASNADVNASDSVDILDALLILQYSVGWNVELL